LDDGRFGRSIRVLVDFMAGITHRGVILGLDIGDARIGVAISDELGIAAHPLCTITRKNRKVDLAALHALIDAHGVEQIVIGLPLRLNGEIGIQAQKVKKICCGFGAYIQSADFFLG
jgi:RNase H-fold protein (predicted Holliday junction resolvase)